VNDYNNGFCIFDITVKVNPLLRASRSPACYAVAMTKNGNTAFCYANNGYLTSWDISDKSNPVSIGSIDIGYPGNF
jgi:hypothetical protein